VQSSIWARGTGSSCVCMLVAIVCWGGAAGTVHHRGAWHKVIVRACAFAMVCMGGAAGAA